MTPETPTRLGYLAVSGLECGDCAAELREALLGAEGVRMAAVFPEEGLAAVTYAPKTARPADLRALVRAAAIVRGRGYRVGWMGSRRMWGVGDE